jgi:pyrroline-5-carboxylate reductase
VFLSPRGARTAAELSERFEGVQVCAYNQEVVDRAEVVIIAVRRQDQREALAGLRVDGDKLVVNVMAGVGSDDLRQTLATDAPLVRAIPLPAVRERRAVTVTCPSHPVVNSLFKHLGGVLPVADEAAFTVFSALTGTLTSHYWYLATLTSWAVGHGIAADEADGYVRGLFQGVGRALGDETRSLRQLAADHETPNGSNERIRTTWFDPANSEALTKALDDLLADLGKVSVEEPAE